MLSDSIQGASPLLLEYWKPVFGFENWYAVSNVGNVRRIGKSSRAQVGRVLKPKVTPAGYLAVCLSVKNKKYDRFVHVLVAEAFIYPKPDGMTVNHENGNKAKPWLSNLEYLTQLANNEHAQRIGLYHRGEQINTAIVNAAQVKEMRRLKGKMSLQAIGDRYGLTKSAVWLILAGKNWKHVT